MLDPQHEYCGVISCATFHPGGCGEHWARGSAYLLLCSDDLSLPGHLQCSLSLVSPPASDGWEVPLRRPLWT